MHGGHEILDERIPLRLVAGQDIDAAAEVTDIRDIILRGCASCPYPLQIQSCKR
jgi:hypothetical protein